MNNPPDESLLGHYLLENPWPIGLLSVAVGGILALLWMRQGDGRLAIAAGVALLVSAIVFLVEAVVVVWYLRNEVAVSVVIVEGSSKYVDCSLAPSLFLY